MSLAPVPDPASLLAAEREHLRKSWFWLLLLGILLILVGFALALMVMRGRRRA